MTPTNKVPLTKGGKKRPARRSTRRLIRWPGVEPGGSRSLYFKCKMILSFSQGIKWSPARRCAAIEVIQPAFRHDAFRPAREGRNDARHGMGQRYSVRKVLPARVPPGCDRRTPGRQRRPVGRQALHWRSRQKPNPARRPGNPSSGTRCCCQRKPGAGFQR